MDPYLSPALASIGIYVHPCIGGQDLSRAVRVNKDADFLGFDRSSYLNLTMVYFLVYTCANPQVLYR